MNITLSFIQLMTILINCIYEYKKKYVSIFMWATLLVMFGIPHFLATVSGDAPYNEEVMTKASIFVVLFNLIYLFTRILIIQIQNGFSKDKILNGINKFPDKVQNYSGQNKRLTISFFTLLILSFLTLIIAGITYSGSLSNISWGQLREMSNELGFANPIKYSTFLFFASSGVSLVYKKFNRKIMFMISLGIILSYAMLTGNRITILPGFMAIIIPYVLDSKREIAFKQFVLFGFMGLFVIYAIYFMRLLRIYGGFYYVLNQFDFQRFNSQVFDMLLNGDGELALRKAFYYFIYYDNDFLNFNKGHTYIRLLLIAIPTSLSGGLKPPDFAISMGSAWSNNPSNTEYSMHPTLYGDCFANLWWFGIFLGVFWAFFSYLISKFSYGKNIVTKNMFSVLFGTMFVIIARGSVYNGVFIAFTGTIIILALNLFSRVRL